MVQLLSAGLIYNPGLTKTKVILSSPFRCQPESSIFLIHSVAKRNSVSFQTIPAKAGIQGGAEIITLENEITLRNGETLTTRVLYFRIHRD